VSEISLLFQLDAARARIAALEAQLPAGMQNCTIRFVECEKGHGILTATNWVQSCPHCRNAALEAALGEIAGDDPGLSGDIARAALEQNK